MPDIFLRAGEPNPDDVRLQDPTSVGASTTGTGASTFPAPVLSGNGKERFTGTGATSFATLAAAGTAKLTFTGSGATALPHPLLTGSGRVPVSGVGATSIPPPLLSGNGAVPTFEWHKIVARRGVGVAGFQQFPILPRKIDGFGVDTDIRAPRLSGSGRVTDNEDWVVDEDLLAIAS